MADKTGIEWTDATWNPVRGCSKVSAGCENCYAMHVAARFSADEVVYYANGIPDLIRPAQPYHGLAEMTPSGPRWTGKVRLIPEHLDDPLRWKRPRRIFVNSMSDLFHEGLKDEEIAAVFGVMVSAPQHTFQILTKRPRRMLEWMRWASKQSVAVFLEAAEDLGVKLPNFGCGLWPEPKNVWLGVSVEDQKTADERIPLLLQTPAAVRFLSAEPLLGPVNLAEAVKSWTTHHLCASVSGMLRNKSFDGLQDNAGRPLSRAEAEAELKRLAAAGVNVIPATDCNDFDPDKGCRGHARPRVDWVIVGGESGPKARPFDIAWARAVVEDCSRSTVKCFVKQLGAKPYQSPERDFGTGFEMALKDRKGGDMSEWPNDLRIREFPHA